MELTIATWNINSVRLRAGIVARFLEEEAPDVLCLQETKTPVQKFPVEPFAALGYTHIVARGEKGYNGVAIMARVPLEPVQHVDFCARGRCPPCLCAPARRGAAAQLLRSCRGRRAGSRQEPEVRTQA